MSADFQAALAAAQGRVGDHLRHVLRDGSGGLADAMLYATLGGKCLRGFLVLESARLHGIAPQKAGHAATAVECLHAYSLIHDDLPCMDDDDLRRGQPTVHRQWDEAVAVLAGDALQSLCFELLAGGSNAGAMTRSMAQAAGWRGMVGGQMLDIAAESASAPLTLDQITNLQAGKTGALITWSATAGALLAGAPQDALRRYGDDLGLAFQIADDLLDVTGDAAKVGKAVGKDAAAGKATFVSLLGLDGAKRRADDLVQSACDALSEFGDEAETLRQAARFVISRNS